MKSNIKSNILWLVANGGFPALRKAYKRGLVPSAFWTALEGSDLRGLSFYGDLRGANFQGADLRGANFQGADLRGADLRGADLYRADLRGADLRGADLRGANLIDSNLRGADLRYVRRGCGDGPFMGHVDAATLLPPRPRPTILHLSSKW